MSDLYNNLKEINKVRKQNNCSYYSLKYISGKQLGLISKLRTSTTVIRYINTLKDIYIFLKDNPSYCISNLSYLDNFLCIKNSYSISENLFCDILSAITSYLTKDKNLYIVKVNSIDEYISRSVLLKKAIVLEKRKSFAIIEEGLDIKLISDLVLRLERTNYMKFRGLECKSIYINNLDITNLEHLESFFTNCFYTESIKLENFDTKYICSLANMFANCRQLKNIDISCFDTSNVVDITGMFAYCAFNELDLSDLDFSNINSADYAFADCKQLKELRLNNFNEQIIGNSYHIFDGCNSIKNIVINGVKYDK